MPKEMYKVILYIMYSSGLRIGKSVILKLKLLILIYPSAKPLLYLYKIVLFTALISFPLYTIKYKYSTLILIF